MNMRETSTVRSPSRKKRTRYHELLATVDEELEMRCDDMMLYIASHCIGTARTAQPLQAQRLAIV